VITEIFLGVHTEIASAAGRSQPRNSYAVAQSKDLDSLAHSDDHADDLMARDQR
jgi:hypothetical protein